MIRWGRGSYSRGSNGEETIELLAATQVDWV
jgi:hypothetical protein